MTPWAGFFAAIIAGWIIRDPRRAVVTALFPYLVVLAMQSWIIGDGRAVSPPSTVTAWPSDIGYFLVQVVFLALSVGIAAELGALRRHRQPADDGAQTGRRTRLAAVVLAGLTIAFGVGYWLDSSPVAVHSPNGAPPVQGTVGILLCVVTLAALSVLIIRRRRVSTREKLAAVSASQAVASPIGRQ